MRFSALFQHPVPRLPAEAAPPRVEQAAPADAAALPAALPEDLDLDARVRMVGEWQLLEG